MEQWKNIPLFEGVYQVSNYGRIKRLDHQFKSKKDGRLWKFKEKLLKTSPTETGYLKKRFKHNGFEKDYKIHKLVATLFVPNPNNKPEVNHKDGDKTNNHHTNLEWCSRSENMQHAFSNNLRQPLRGSKNGMTKLTAQQVKEIRINKDKGTTVLAKDYGTSPQNIYNILNYKSWKYLK